VGEADGRDLLTRMTRITHESGLAAKCAKLQSQAITADDTVKFLRTVRSKVDETVRWNDYVGAVGVATYGVVVITDALMDLVGKPVAKTPGLLILTMAYDKARKYRIDRTRKNEHIEKLKKLKQALSKALPKQYRSVADGFVNMAENFTGLVAFMQDSNDAGASARRASATLQREISKLEASLQSLVDAYNQHCLVPENRLS
jgi:hypothetical protein